MCAKVLKIGLLSSNTIVYVIFTSLKSTQNLQIQNTSAFYFKQLNKEIVNSLMRKIYNATTWLGSSYMNSLVRIDKQGNQLN